MICLEMAEPLIVKGKTRFFPVDVPLHEPLPPTVHHKKKCPYWVLAMVVLHTLLVQCGKPNRKISLKFPCMGWIPTNHQWNFIIVTGCMTVYD